MQLKHWKFVGWVESIDTPGNTWIQRVVKSTFFGEEQLDIEWLLTTIPLPDNVEVGTFISVHRTKAGQWYAVNLSERMGPITEPQVKRAKARAKRMRRALGLDSDRRPGPTIG